MAVGAIGNAIFVNQQTATASSIQGNQNNRFDLQNVMAQAAANEKEEKVLEVRPAEENQEVDPDKEHQKQDADEENKRNEKQSQDTENNEKKENFTLHKLDIKV
jgi:hypothetical protein